MGAAENPFSRMLGLMRQQAGEASGPAWAMGEVLGTDPLRILYQGVTLTAAQIPGAAQWAQVLQVGDQVPVLPDRGDGSFIILLPGAPVGHNHDTAYAPANHDHNDAYLGKTAKAADSSGLDGSTLAQVLVAAKLAAHPVGSIYESTDSTDPGTLFGGTWEAFGAGRVLIGLDAADGDFDTAGETGGSKLHEHIVSGVAKISYGTSSASIYAKRVSVASWEATHKVTGAANTLGDTTSSSYGTEVSGSAASVPGNSLQPYVVVYRWRRTA